MSGISKLLKFAQCWLDHLPDHLSRDGGWGGEVEKGGSPVPNNAKKKKE